VHGLTAYVLHGQHDQAVVEQQQVAGADIARQFLVIQPHTTDIPRLGARGVQDKGRSLLQHDLAFGELANPDLWALKVGHDGHLAAGALRRLAHQRGAVDVVLRLAVAEVQPHHIDAGIDHGHQQGGIARRGSEGGDDLGGAMWHEGHFLVGGRRFSHGSRAERVWQPRRRSSLPAG
jgi:hypothetical protein